MDLVTFARGMCKTVFNPTPASSQRNFDQYHIPVDTLDEASPIIIFVCVCSQYFLIFSNIR